MDFIKKALLGTELYTKCQSEFATDSEIEKRLENLNYKGLHLSKDELLSLCNLNVNIDLKIEDEKLNEIFYSETKQNLFCRIMKLNCNNEKEYEEIKRLATLEKDQIDELGEFTSLSLLCDYRDEYSIDIYNNFYYVALRKNEKGSDIICAVMLVVPTGHFLKIAYLTSRAHSDREYRGVGRMLIDKVIEDYSSSSSYLGIWLESSNQAHEFYKKLGFNPDSHKFYYYYLFPSFTQVLNKELKIDISNDIDILIENSSDLILKNLITKGFLSPKQLDDIRNSPGLYNDLFKFIALDDKHIKKLLQNYSKNDYRLLITYIKNGVNFDQNAINYIFDYYIGLRQKIPVKTEKKIEGVFSGLEEKGFKIDKQKLSIGVDVNFVKILNALEETGYKFNRDNIIRLSYLIGSKNFEEVLSKFKGSRGDFIEILNSISSEKHQEVVNKFISANIEQSGKGCTIQ